MRMAGILSLSQIFRAIVIGSLFLNVGCCWCGNGMAANRVGMRQYKRGNYAQARHHFARAIARNPCNPDYRHNLAMALQKQGDPLAAEKIFRHNLTINAMHQPTYHSLAQNLMSQGRPTEAQDLMLAWADTQPYVPEANIELAWVQRETGNTAGAEQALQNALKADPTNPTALAHLGQYYQETGRTDQAVAYYQRSLTAKWDQPEVQSRLSTLTEPRRATRSAMMQNSFDAPMMASGPMMGDGPMMVSYPTMPGAPEMVSAGPFNSDAQAVALEDLRANPKPRRLSRKGDKNRDDSILTAYPLPNYDAPTTAWIPSGSVAGQPAMASLSYGSPVEMGMMPPQMTDFTQSPTPMMSSGPTPIMASGPTPITPIADPAHFAGSSPDMTASIPVVDPH